MWTVAHCTQSEWHYMFFAPHVRRRALQVHGHSQVTPTALVRRKMLQISQMQGDSMEADWQP
eukprot:5309886-Amphidinium_carterae.1